VDILTAPFVPSEAKEMRSALIQMEDEIDTAVQKAEAKGRTISSTDLERIKSKFIDAMKLKGEAEKTYGTFDIEAKMSQTLANVGAYKETLKRTRYNKYDSIGGALKTSALDQQKELMINLIKAEIEDSIGISISDLSAQDTIFRELDQINPSLYSLRKLLQNSDKGLGAIIRQQGIISGDMLAAILDKETSPDYVNAVKAEIFDILSANKNQAKINVANALQKTLTDAAEGRVLNVADVMRKFLYEAEEMKGAVKKATTEITASDRVRAYLGNMISDVIVEYGDDIVIEVPGAAASITLSQLSNYAHLTMEEGATKGVQGHVEAIEKLLRTLSEGLLDNDNNPLNLESVDVFDRGILGQVLKVERGQATNLETGALTDIPTLANKAEIDTLIDNMISAGELPEKINSNFLPQKIDSQFLEEFRLVNSSDEGVAEALITKRISASKQPLDSLATQTQINERMAEIANEVNERLLTLKLIKQRISLRGSLEQDEFKVIASYFQGKGATGTPSLAGVTDDKVLSSFDEAIDRIVAQYVPDEITAADIQRAIDMGVGSAAPTTPPNAAKYTRIQDFIKRGDFQELYQGVVKHKNKFLAAAAVAVGLTAYAKINKKDHSQEALSGPPLLPGGNPYERIPSNPMMISDAPIASSDGGVSYNISINEDQEKLEEFMSRARITN